MLGQHSKSRLIALKCAVCATHCTVLRNSGILPFVSHREAVALINNLINTTYFYFADADTSFLITLSLFCQAPLMASSSLSRSPAIVAHTIGILMRAFSVYHTQWLSKYPSIQRGPLLSTSDPHGSLGGIAAVKFTRVTLVACHC